MKQSIETVLNINAAQLHAYSSGLLQGTAYSRLHRHLTRALLPYSLSIPEWKLLGQVHENKKVKLNELATLLSYDPPMVTKLAKMLEKKKLLKRMPDEHDERAKVINITTKGTQLIQEIEPVIKKTMAQILHGVSREELVIYIKVLTTIVNNTEE